MSRKSIPVSTIIVLTLVAVSAAQVSVTTYHNSNTRTGQNINELVLRPANVNVTTFGRLFTRSLDGQVYVQPLYVPNVVIPNKGVHNVVYVATEHDSVYAFDADSNTGANAGPLWKVSFINPQAGVTTIPSTDYVACVDLSPEIGITGTPVIDANTGTMYLVARTKETGQYVERLHALDITTGAEKFGGPVAIQASVPGTGEGGTVVQFNPFTQNQRAGLVLQNGLVYIGFALLCEAEPFHGWLLAYGAQSLQQVGVWNSSPNGKWNGIWAGGAAPAVDNNSNLFFATGDGTFDLPAGGSDFGSSVVKLPPPPGSGTWLASDFFTPYNQATLTQKNLDLGSGGVVLFPDQPVGSPHQHLMVTGGKEGTIYLLDRDQLGHFNPNNNSQIVQVLPLALNGLWGSPAWWNNNAYFSGSNDVVKSFSFDPVSGLLSTSPVSQSSSSYQYINGSTPSVSANGISNGIVWAAENHLRVARMHAYDATNLATELYNTTQSPTRDGAGAGIRFMVPTVANGKVYLATNNLLGVYGLFMFLPATLSFPAQLASTTSATRTTTFTNPNPATMHISSITVTGQFTVTGGTCPIAGGTLAPGISCTIGVAFAPQGGGTKSGSLKVNIVGSSSPLTIPLTGIGKSVTFAPLTLNWGTPILLSHTSAPKLVSVTIWGTDPTTFNSVNIGTNSAEFAISSNTCVGSITGPNQCSIYVTFTPQNSGTRTGTLNLGDTSGNQIISLTGTGEGVQLTPASLGFGTLPVGNTSAAKTVTVGVLGSTAATFGTITIGGTNPGDYSLQSDTCSTKTVAGGSNCQVSVVFKPTASGSRPASLSIPNNDGPSPLLLNLSGSGQ